MPKVGNDHTMLVQLYAPIASEVATDGAPGGSNLGELLAKIRG